MSTGHANSAQDMMLRIETMTLMGMELPIAAIRSQITAAIEICVHLERSEGGRRQVRGIYEVMPHTEGQVELAPLFTRDGKELVTCGDLIRKEKMKRYEANLEAAASS